MNPNTNQALAETLNGLVATLKCSEEGFRGASNRFTNRKLGDQFMLYAYERERFASEFQDMVANLGGKPVLSGSAVCAMHQGWQSLKDSIKGIDDLGILAEAQSGETSVAHYLRGAIAKGLPDDIEEMVGSQLEDVVATCDHLKELQETVIIVAGRPTAQVD